jgi:hypothetical protein
VTPTSRTRRAAAWLLLLLFAAIVGEPLRGHACPVHAALGAAAQDAGEDAHGGHGSHAEHGADADETPAGGGHDSHQCDCLGTCSSGAAARVPQTLALRLVEVGLVEAPAPPTRLMPVATSGDHVLPFANGPPTLA